MLFRPVLIAVLWLGCTNGQVVITSVEPSRGSLAGGTRMHIKGRGFSENLNEMGNLVLIGGRFRCDVIPLHSTVNQIACKTRSAIDDGAPGSSGPWRDGGNMRTADLEVTVLVDGIYPSVCQNSEPRKCRFR